MCETPCGIKPPKVIAPAPEPAPAPEDPAAAASSGKGKGKGNGQDKGKADPSAEEKERKHVEDLLNKRGPDGNSLCPFHLTSHCIKGDKCRALAGRPER